MADTATAPAPATAPATVGPAEAPRQRNEERGRGGRNQGRNRRARGGSQANERPQEDRQRRQGRRPRDQVKLRPAAEAAEDKPAEEKSAERAESVASEDNICFICANPIIYHSVAPCNHRTCHICALRMRALYRTKQCPHCRTESEFVIFSHDPEKLYEDYNISKMLSLNEDLGIKFDAKHIKADTELLLRFNCPDPSCDEACKGWGDLNRHVRAAHQRWLCTLCSQFKKVFTHEHTLFTEKDLRRHERYGDDEPGSENQSGFKGHPECSFCRKRFYGSDELYQHCKTEHERCFLCDRVDPNRPQYFQNYDTLEVHFRKDHFLCAETECMEKKFVVFASELDLKAHQVEDHPNGLSKNALKEARRIDMSHFTEAHGRGRGQYGGSRRQPRDHRLDPQAPDPPPPPRDQLRRDELAFQRTLAVQSAQSTTTRQFGGQLTAPGPAFAAPPARVATPQTMTVPSPQTMSVPFPVQREPGYGNSSTSEAFPTLNRVNLRTQPTGIPRSSPSGSSSNLPATAEEARQRKHDAVIERASFLLRQNQPKIEKFTKYVSNFRASTMSGMDLLDAFWSLFDINFIDLGKLVRELADLYEEEAKKQELLTAWNRWRASNDDYPPMASSSSAGHPTRSGDTARVLNIKSATTRNLRGGPAGSSPWLNVNSNTIRNSAGSLASLAGPIPTAAKKSVTPWAGAVKGGSSGSSAARAGPSASSSSTPRSTAEFPSLPPKTNIHPPVPRKHEGVPPASVWGGERGGASGSGNEYSSAPDDFEPAISAKKKGKKKELLFHFG